MNLPALPPDAAVDWSAATGYTARLGRRVVGTFDRYDDANTAIHTALGHVRSTTQPPKRRPAPPTDLDL